MKYLCLALTCIPLANHAAQSKNFNTCARKKHAWDAMRDIASIETQPPGAVQVLTSQHQKAWEQACIHIAKDEPQALAAILDQTDYIARVYTCLADPQQSDTATVSNVKTLMEFAIDCKSSQGVIATLLAHNPPLDATYTIHYNVTIGDTITPLAHQRKEPIKQAIEQKNVAAFCLLLPAWQETQGSREPLRKMLLAQKNNSINADTAPTDEMLEAASATACSIQ